MEHEHPQKAVGTISSWWERRSRAHACTAREQKTNMPLLHFHCIIAWLRESSIWSSGRRATFQHADVMQECRSELTGCRETHNCQGANSGATQQQVLTVNSQRAQLIDYDCSKLFELKQAQIYLPKLHPPVLIAVHCLFEFLHVLCLVPCVNIWIKRSAKIGSHVL